MLWAGSKFAKFRRENILIIVVGKRYIAGNWTIKLLLPTFILMGSWWVHPVSRGEWRIYIFMIRTSLKSTSLLNCHFNWYFVHELSVLLWWKARYSKVGTCGHLRYCHMLNVKYRLPSVITYKGYTITGCLTVTLEPVCHMNKLRC